MSCDLGINGVNQDPELWACTPTSGTYLVFGTDASGNDFCCEGTVSPSLGELSVDGTSRSDAVRLLCSGADLNADTTSVSTGDGNDLIVGSDDASCEDSLDGGDDNDNIDGQAGNDSIYGGGAQD